MKKRIAALSLALALAVSVTACKKDEGIYTAGTYTGTAQGYGGTVTVTLTTDTKSITDVTIAGDQETAGIGGAALEPLAEQIKTAQSAEIDGVSGATITSDAVKAAAAAAIAAAKGETNNAELAFTAGTYNGKAQGYLGEVELAVTFSDSAVTGIEIVSEKETAHVGTSAYDILFEDIKAANGTGVDSVSGATFTSRAIKEAVNDAATQASATNLAAFQANTIEVKAGDPIEDTWDVVIVGAGGAGMAAAAQAAQNGDTVLVIETNAEIGGNTLMAGGGAAGFQAYVPYLCWDANDPDATTGYCEYDGQTYDKVKSDAGRLETLKTILTWSEEPFDGTVDADHPFQAGNVALNAVRGVHPEYLDTLKTLKSQIQAYVNWADKKIAAGAKETDLAVFGSNELHLFQTYYGGLRPNADNTEWIYPQIELASQFVNDSLDLKYWLMDQGANITMDIQRTLVGCLWQRINGINNATVNGEELHGNWGVLLKAPENTMLTANEHNQVMTRTTATELITEGGKVTGVKAVKYDGTQVTAHANKGVILATGGYGANVKMAQEYNEYWKSEYLADNIGTTNRSSLKGDGITMGLAVGADVTGMGWPQMMPLGWVDNGNLSLGAGENVIFINAATGKRYVDESAERDVLSLGGFENGMSEELASELGLKNVAGIYVELSNPNTNNKHPGMVPAEGRCYIWTVDELAEKLHLDKQTIIDTITEYDNYVMGVSDTLEVEKLSYYDTIGDVEKDEEGHYKPETYKIDKIAVRFQAPSTHHTMGGLTVDTERHVLDKDGNPIAGLYAAGEVTGGLFGGNRLGGNAVTEIVSSGRIAANAVNADNQ